MFSGRSTKDTARRSAATKKEDDRRISCFVFVFFASFLVPSSSQSTNTAMKTAQYLAAIVFFVVPAGILSANDEPEVTAHHRPPEPVPVAAADLEAALTRGVEYLVEHQNKDGSW